MAAVLPSLENLIDNYLQCCTAEGKSRKTIEWHETNLKRFTHFLKKEHPGSAVSDIGHQKPADLSSTFRTMYGGGRQIPSSMTQRGCLPHTIHGYARATRTFWSWLLDEGCIGENSMARLKCPRTPRRIIPTFTTEQTERLLATLDPGTSTGFRNYAIILLFADTGIRLSELISLRLEDIDFGQSCLRVTGKGNKERTVPFGSQVRRVLWRYLTTVRPELESPQVSQFFLSRQGEILRPNLVSYPTKLGDCPATPYGKYSGLQPF